MYIYIKKANSKSQCRMLKTNHTKFIVPFYAITLFIKNNLICNNMSSYSISHKYTKLMV